MIFLGRCFLRGVCVLLDIVQESKILHAESTFVSIFSTVPSTLGGFKHLLVLYNDLKEMEKQVLTA